MENCGGILTGQDREEVTAILPNFLWLDSVPKWWFPLRMQCKLVVSVFGRKTSPDIDYHFSFKSHCQNVFCGSSFNGRFLIWSHYFRNKQTKNRCPYESKWTAKQYKEIILELENPGSLFSLKISKLKHKVSNKWLTKNISNIFPSSTLLTCKFFMEYCFTN